jgi:hypothetical protein
LSGSSTGEGNVMIMDSNHALKEQDKTITGLTRP